MNMTEKTILETATRTAPRRQGAAVHVGRSHATVHLRRIHVWHRGVLVGAPLVSRAGGVAGRRDDAGEATRALLHYLTI